LPNNSFSRILRDLPLASGSRHRRDRQRRDNPEVVLMSETEHASADHEREKYTSTAYSDSIRCGICGAPVRHIPMMYERMNIEWRCSRCLRRDKPVLEDQT